MLTNFFKEIMVETRRENFYLHLIIVQNVNRRRRIAGKHDAGIPKPWPCEHRVPDSPESDFCGAETRCQPVHVRCQYAATRTVEGKTNISNQI